MRELIVMVGPPGAGLAARGRTGEARVSPERIRSVLFGSGEDPAPEELVDRVLSRVLVELIDSDLAAVSVEGPTATRRERATLIDAGRLAGRRVVARVAPIGPIDALYDAYRRDSRSSRSGAPISRSAFEAAIARIEPIGDDEGFSAIEPLVPTPAGAGTDAAAKRTRTERKPPIPLFAG